MLLLVLGGATPTTQSLTEAAKWLSRAADETSHVDSTIARADDQVAILEARAQIDQPGDHPQTLRAFGIAFDEREKAYADRDQAIASSGAIRHPLFNSGDDSAYLECFYFCQLAEIYADRGMTTAWRDVLGVASRWYDRIPKDDAHGNLVRELQDIAEVKAIGGDLKSAGETLDRVQPEAERIPMINRIARELEERGRHAEAMQFAERGLPLIERIGDDRWARSDEMYLLLMLDRIDDLRKMIDADKSKFANQTKVKMLVQIAIAEAKQGKHAESQADIDAALSVPLDPIYRQGIYTGQAIIFAKSGDQDNAMLFIKRARACLDQMPTTRPSDLRAIREDRDSINATMVDISLARDDLKGAQEAFDSVTQFVPVFESEYLDRIALLQLDNEDYDGARKTIAKFEDAGHGMFCQNAAAILAAKGNLDELQSWLSSVKDPDDRFYFCLGAVDGFSGSRPPKYETSYWIEPHHNKSLP